MSSRTPLGRAYVLASNISREIRREGVPVDELTLVGGVRRYAPDVGEVALLALAPATRHGQIFSAIARLASVSSATPRPPAGLTLSTLALSTPRGDITVHAAAPEQAGAALVWHTGSRRHVERLTRRAAERGLRFEDGLLTRNGSPLVTRAETDVYAALGLPFIAPELRQGDEEFTAAAETRLPQLVADAHIRGDLHMHSTWSDGRDRIEDMVGAARQLGYEYVAITDHSQRAMSSRTLAADDVSRQRTEVEELRRRTPGIQILHGIEVDIMPDGTLDFDDTLLAGFDIVLASLHDHAGHDREALTHRSLAAIAHPLVNVISHPANRTAAMPAGYDLDFERIFAAAAETGTALEIDGAPGHLDMDGPLARRAVTAGVTVTIDSDSHRAEWMGRQMRFGVGTARRGWVEPQHVLNTRGVDEVRAFVARKRARG